MSTIPANELISVTPSVLSAGGSGIDITAMVLTTNPRVPTNSVVSFPDGASVTDYFGGSTIESQIANGGANYGSGYFGGFDNSNKKPAVLRFAQYNEDDVAAYIRGGDVSALTLAQLQAIIGSLDIVVDGYPRNAASVDLSTATSFSSAATIIATALNTADPTEASVTASLGAAFTGSQSGTNLTTTSVTGIISVGDAITGTGVAANTVIVSQTSGPAGGAGVYVTNLSGTASTAACVATSTVLDVTVVASGTIEVGQYVTGSGVTSAVITAEISGTGGVGTYRIAGAKQHVASESMTITGTPVAVTYDSTSGGFVITSGITGANSLIAYATGTISDDLKMTLVTGAVLSQGADAAVPATFMSALTELTANWATFFTAFDPDEEGENTVKQAFAAWKNSQNNRYGYICWDLDQSPVATLPASSSLGAILTANGDSGTCLLDGQDANGWALNPAVALASFAAGAAAAIDFTERNGRISFAYKAQAGLLATVTNSLAANNLAGPPQVANSYGNGYNFYGAYGAANQNDIWFQRGLVTGPFRWLDSYINQIWMSTTFQNALLALQGAARSLPYGVVGAGMIENALQTSIQAALNFGAFGPGVLSSSQIANVNASAGAKISDAIQGQGYYLQILPGTPDQRASRTSPPCKFWYLDRGSVQAINLASIALT